MVSRLTHGYSREDVALAELIKERSNCTFIHAKTCIVNKQEKFRGHPNRTVHHAFIAIDICGMLIYSLRLSIGPRTRWGVNIRGSRKGSSLSFLIIQKFGLSWGIESIWSPAHSLTTGVHRNMARACGFSDYLHALCEAVGKYPVEMCKLT